VEDPYGAEGGGFDCYFAVNPTVTNCLFIDNHAKTFGGGINSDSTTVLITNCTVSGNTSEIGGGMSFKSSTTLVLNSR